MYQFEEKSQWLKNLEEELHEDLKDLETFEGDRVYDSLQDLLTNGRDKRDKSPTNLKNSKWLSSLKRGYMLEHEDEYGKRNLLIPFEIFEDYESYVKSSLIDCIVDGVEISVDTAVKYDDRLAFKDGLEMLCIRGEVIRENVEEEEDREDVYSFQKTLVEYLEKVKIDIDLAFQEVGSAWNDPGRAPGYHRKMQNKLRKEWPVLAAALDRL